MNNTRLVNKTFFVNNTSGSGQADGYLFDGVGECPKWIMYGFLAVFFCGSCINLLEAFALLRYKKNGILSIILQIALADTLLFFVAIPELLSTYYQTWKFGNQICMLYRGTEVLANTLVAYLLVCLNFHIITFWNLHNSEEIKKNKNPLTSFHESSSSECLVTRSETRIVTIDYRKRKNDVPVTFPVILLWILCVSVSLPKYVLSTKVEMHGSVLCVVLQNSYGKTLHSLLLVFSVVVPCSLLLISLLILVYQLSKTSKRGIENLLSKQLNEIRRLLLFGIVLTLFYMTTSYQKHIFHMIITIKEFFILENYYYNNFCNVYQAMLHYGGISLRGVICYFAVSDVKRAIESKMFCVNKEPQ